MFIYSGRGDGPIFGGLQKLLEVWRGVKIKFHLNRGSIKIKLMEPQGGQLKKRLNTMDSQ